MTSAAPALEGTAPASDPIVDEPLTSAPSESTFDELAKLFTSPEAAPAPAAAPEAPAEDSLGLIHEGEDVLGRAAEMQGAPEPSAIDGVAAGRAETAAAPSQTPVFSAPFLDALGAAEPPPPAPEPAAVPTAAAPPAPPAPAQEPPREAADPAAAFVTETMAELYLKQGHQELALDVYRKLVALHPEDAALRARLAELERPSPPPAAAAAPVAEAGPTIREFLVSIAEFRPNSSANGGSVPPAPPTSTIPADRAARPNEDGTVGTSLHSLFVDAEAQQDGAAPPTAAAPPADLPFLDAASSPPEQPKMAGRPATPAANELSLDHVFRHATPAAGTGTQPPSFSFDQFFSQQAHQDVSASDSEASSDESGGAKDDIQQFNAWLEGLKKT
jgi:hypothetical protein